MFICHERGRKRVPDTHTRWTLLVTKWAICTLGELGHLTENLVMNLKRWNSQHDTSVESSTWIKPMTSRRPGRRSIHWATRAHGEQSHLAEFMYDKRPAYCWDRQCRKSLCVIDFEQIGKLMGKEALASYFARKVGSLFKSGIYFKLGAKWKKCDPLSLQWKLFSWASAGQ